MKADSTSQLAEIGPSPDGRPRDHGPEFRGNRVSSATGLPVWQWRLKIATGAVADTVHSRGFADERLPVHPVVAVERPSAFTRDWFSTTPGPVGPGPSRQVFLTPCHKAGDLESRESQRIQNEDCLTTTNVAQTAAGMAVCCHAVWQCSGADALP